MKQLRSLWPLLLVVTLTVLSGVVSGELSNRWGPPASAALSAARIAELPAEFGDWQLEAETPIEPEVIEMLQCGGNLHRVYRNRETGQMVNMVLFAGPPGPISAHTPEICYSTHDYDQLAAPRRHHLHPTENSEAAVWKMNFRANTVQGETLSVAYTWNAGQGWVAPDSPRITFAGQPLLYKLQLSGQVNSELAGEAGDPCASFLEAFLPVCDATLFTPLPQ